MSFLLCKLSFYYCKNQWMNEWMTWPTDTWNTTADDAQTIVKHSICQSCSSIVAEMIRSGCYTDAQWTQCCECVVLAAVSWQLQSAGHSSVPHWKSFVYSTPEDKRPGTRLHQLCLFTVKARGQPRHLKADKDTPRLRPAENTFESLSSIALSAMASTIRHAMHAVCPKADGQWWSPPDNVLYQDA